MEWFKLRVLSTSKAITPPTNPFHGSPEIFDVVVKLTPSFLNVIICT